MVATTSLSSKGNASDEWLADFRGVALFVIGLAIAGCASAPTLPPPIEDASEPPPATIDAPVPLPEADQPEPVNQATLALRDRSAVAARDGDSRQAVALLERAIRIEPRNAALWSDLARVQVNAGDIGRAEQSARKAIALASASTRPRLDVERTAWLVIADVRDAQDRAREATEIRQRWRSARG